MEKNYFYVIDEVDNKQFIVECYPGHKKLADYTSKHHKERHHKEVIKGLVGHSHTVEDTCSINRFGVSPECSAPLLSLPIYLWMCALSAAARSNFSASIGPGGRTARDL